MKTMKNSDAIERLIEESLGERKHRFVPGTTVITTGYAGFGTAEIMAVIRSLHGGWLGFSREGAAFEKEFSRVTGSPHAVMTGSGSSANLLAVAFPRYPVAPTIRIMTTSKFLDPAWQTLMIDLSLTSSPC